MNRLRFKERNIHGPFRHQVHITHENHGVIDWVLQTSSPGGPNPVDKLSGSQRGEAITVNGKTGNTFRLALEKECQQDSTTINTLRNLKQMLHTISLT